MVCVGVFPEERVGRRLDLGHFEGRADRICRWTGCEREKSKAETERMQETLIERWKTGKTFFALWCVWSGVG